MPKRKLVLIMSKFKFKIKCDEANHVCDKTQYEDASLWEKIILSLHLIYCRACRKYSKNNATLTETIAKSEIVCLEKSCKDAMKKDLDKAIREVSN